MSDYINELFLKLACNTPLPTGTTSYTPNTTSSNTRPFTRSQARSAELSGTPLEPHLESTTTSPAQQKKRNRKPEFTVFIDVDAANTPTQHSSKKTKLTPRLPLAVRTDPGNDSPMPSPRAPDVPWPFSSTDPLWDNCENYFPYTTPPSTPREPSPAQSSYFRPSPRPAPRPARRHRTTTSSTPRAPTNMVLYNLLELEDWKAGTEEIKLAYKKAAMKFHPDKFTADQQQDATIQMQRVNAAKEVLLDAKRRKAYNKSGKLPWDT